MTTKAENKILEVRLFGGLVLDTEALYRAPNTWSRLENFNLTTPGAIQKVFGFAELMPGRVYDSPITAIRTYRRTPNDQRKVIGISINGTVYDLMTGDVLTQFPVVNFPFVGQMQGREGDIEINYLISTTAGFYPSKWNGVDPTTTTLGVTAPTKPAIPSLVWATNDIEKGQSLVVQRVYAYTYWNPITRHESSPSPVTLASRILAPLNLDINTLTLTDPKSALLDVLLSIPTLLPDRGDGYTKIRVYCTRDGGDVFYLARNLNVFDLNGNLIEAADDDGAVSVGAPLVLHGIRDFLDAYSDAALRAGNNIRTVDPDYAGPLVSLPEYNGYPGPPGPVPVKLTPIIPADSILIEPGPLPGENDPPPGAEWGAIYQNRLWLVDADNPLSLRNSKVGDFQSFSADNFFPIPIDDFDEILALDGQEQQLIIGKKRSLSRIVGTNFTDFVLTPLDGQVGTTGRRSFAHSEGIAYFLSQKGIVSYDGGTINFYGKPIRKHTDQILEELKRERIIAEVFSKDNILLFSNANSFIAMNLSEPSPFFLITGLPSEVTSVAEVEDSSGDIFICFGTADQKVYRLFTGTNLVGFAASQLLPQEGITYRKVFRRLKVEGPISPGFEVSFAVDDKPIVGFVPLKEENPIGLVGKQLTIQIRHAQDGPAVLSNFTLDYAIIGETR